MATTATQTEDTAGVNNEPCPWPALESVERTVQTARRVINDARHATQDLAAGTAEKVRQRPLALIGVAAAAGIVAGGLVGLACGLFVRRRP